MLGTLDIWARLDREDLRGRRGNQEKMVKQDEQETPESEASRGHRDHEGFPGLLDLPDSKDTEDTEDSKDRRERPVQSDQRAPQVLLVPWELLDRWGPRGCREREGDPDLAGFRESAVRLETWANPDRWVRWE